MPYKRKGKCVFKENADGSAGDKVGCSDTIAEAKLHLKALYANAPDTSKEAGSTPSPYNAHGPGGVVSAPGQLAPKKTKKVKKVMNAMISPKEFAAQYKTAEKDFGYASAETWVVDSAAQAFSYLMSVARQEMAQAEQSDTKEIVAMMKALSVFIGDQLDEMDTALDTAGDSNGLFTYKETDQPSLEKGLGGYLVTSDGQQHLPTRVNGKLDTRHLAAAKAALTSNYRGHSYAGPDKAGALAKLKKLYGEAGLSWDEKETGIKSTLTTTKEASGKYRWVLQSGSAFEDRDGEIISEKAFANDCDAMELTGDYGELLWWHCDGEVHSERGEKEARPYIPLGKCDFSMVYQKINIESGTYYDDAVGALLESKAKEFGASKQFYYKPDEPVDGVFSYIRTKERSIMPRTKEANLLTRLFSGSKEKAMATNEERKAALEKVVGKDVAADILAQAQKASAEAETFLASKEASKAGKKMPKQDAEDAADAGDDEDAEGETKKGKELMATLTAMKEASEASSKELKSLFETSLKELKESQAKELDEVKTQLAQTQVNVGALLGIQPRNNRVVPASESKENKVTLTAEQQKAAKEAEGQQSQGLEDWLISGTRLAA